MKRIHTPFAYGLFLFFFLISNTFGFSSQRINYNQRLEKLKQMNPIIAQKVERTKRECFTGQYFNYIWFNPIPPSGGFIGLAKMHIFDMEHGVSHKRGLDERRASEQNHPGRLALDIVTDMIKDEIFHEDIKTYEALMKIACSCNKLLSKFKLVSHVTTTVEDKIQRSSGGNCWDHSHVAMRIAKALNIPLYRKNKGVHVFVAYKIPGENKNNSVFFAVDPLYCVNPQWCYHEFIDAKGNNISQAKQLGFGQRMMKQEKCMMNETLAKDPNQLFFK